MFNKELIKQQNGSISVYAIAMVLCFTMILGGIFFSSKVIRTIELKTLLKIKDVYIQDDNTEKIAKIESDRKLADTSGYVKKDLVVFYDAINNMGSSHSNNAKVWRDLSGHGNDAIYSGSGELTWNDKAYDFVDTANNYFASKNAISLGNKSRTIEVVCSLEEDGVENIIGFGSNTSGALNDIIYYNNGINLNNYNDTDSQKGINYKLKLGKTYSNTIIYNSENKTATYYTDANSKKNVELDIALNTVSGKLQIGKGINSAHNKNKRLKIQAIRIYDRVLTEEERKTNYELDKARYEVKEDVVEVNKGEMVDKGTKYAKYIERGTNSIAYIPGGYCVVKDVENDTNTIANGLVISDLANDTLDNDLIDGKRGNQFVWVPVPDISSMYDEANKAGKLYDYGTKSSPKAEPETLTYPGTISRGSREPDVVTGAFSGSNSWIGTSYDGAVANLNIITDFTVAEGQTKTAELFKEYLQKEFDNMIASVKKYKGFYIGRYETGNLSQTKAVVQKGNNDISNVNWYNMYQRTKNMEVDNSNVTISMIWGCQWDRTLNWLIETENNGITINEIVDSTTWGNYKDNTEEGHGSKRSSGYNKAWQKNHIYDMAGNVWDWTMEAGGASNRVVRGGDWSISGSNFPACYRDASNPTSYYSNDRFSFHTLCKSVNWFDL